MNSRSRLHKGSKTHPHDMTYRHHTCTYDTRFRHAHVHVALWKRRTSALLVGFSFDETPYQAGARHLVKRCHVSSSPPKTMASIHWSISRLATAMLKQEDTHTRAYAPERGVQDVLHHGRRFGRRQRELPLSPRAGGPRPGPRRRPLSCRAFPFPPAPSCRRRCINRRRCRVGSSIYGSLGG